MDATTVLFDVDGTLVDSERHGHRVAFNDAFAKLGLPYRWDEETYGQLLAITGGRRRLAHYLREQGHDADEADDLAVRLHADKTELFSAACQRGAVPARPGVTRLLDELAAADATVGIVTTGSRGWVEPLLDNLFGLDRFALTLTGDEIDDRKPSPAIYHAALEALGVPAREVVAVEDSRNGLESALAADVPCLLVVNDYTREEDPSGAELVVDGFGDDEPARVLAGDAAAVPDGRVTPDTLAHVLAAARTG